MHPFVGTCMDNLDKNIVGDVKRPNSGTNWTFSLFQWIGNLTLDAYEEDCEFADPAGSFKGLRRFKRNCTNFGSLLEKSNMKLMKWEDFEVSFLSRFQVSFIILRFMVSHLRHLKLLGLQTPPSLSD